MRCAGTGVGLGALGWLLLPALGMAQTGPVHVDGIAAVVGAVSPSADTENVFWSDVRLRGRLLSPDPFSRLPLPKATLDRARSLLVAEALITREAKRVRMGEPTEAQVAAQIDAFRTVLGGARRFSLWLERLGANEGELWEMARRIAWSAMFLKANLVSVAAVPEARVETTFRSGQHPFSGPYAEVRGDLRAWLVRRAINGATLRWVGALRERIAVKTYGVPVLSRAGSRGRGSP